MARRRYISTDISRDARINKLAMQAGDFAALLYTWLIPHVEDDARLKGTAEEVLLMVMPGRRDKQPEDIEAALQAMHDLGLIVWNPGGEEMCFPESFYVYQTYITKDRRARAQGAAQQRQTAPDSAESRPTAHNAADQRTTPQNAASLTVKSSSSFRSSSSSTPPNPQAEPVPATRPQAIRPSASVLNELIDDLMPKIAPDFTAINPQLSATWIRQTLADAEAECDGGAGELSDTDVLDALWTAKDAIGHAVRSQSDEHPIRNPKAFARSAVVEAVCERLNDVREQRHRPPVPPPRRGTIVSKPVPRHQPTSSTADRSP